MLSGRDLALASNLVDELPQIGTTEVRVLDEGCHVGDEVGAVDDDEGHIAAHAQGGVSYGQVFKAAAKIEGVARVGRGKAEGDEVAGFGEGDVLDDGGGETAPFLVDAGVAGQVEGLEGLGFMGVRTIFWSWL